MAPNGTQNAFKIKLTFFLQLRFIVYDLSVL